MEEEEEKKTKQKIKKPASRPRNRKQTYRCYVQVGNLS